MSLRQGRSYLAIPGPSVIPDAVLQAMHRPSPNIYEGELVELTRSIIPDLCHVAQTRHHVAIYIGNGHAAWEAALANVMQAGDKALVLATGRFAYGWSEMAEALGMHTQIVDFGKQNPVDPDQVETALRADRNRDIRAVLLTHVDTSTSIRNDVTLVRQAMDAAGHPALLMVDCIASLGCDRFEMDNWGADVVVGASQKGIMVPAGLGFVWFNDRAAERRKSLWRVSRYWDWMPRVNPEIYYQYFAGTAPTHHLYGLRVALDMILTEGLEAVWARHKTLAHAIWAACKAWGQGGALALNVANPAHRSHAVTSLHLPVPGGTQLRQWTEEQVGVTLGIGLGMAEPGTPEADAYFRLGHMGHVNGQMVLGLLGSIEAGLNALQIPHGTGALDAAARIIADVNC